MAKQFLELSGIMNIAAGVLLLAFWYLYALLLPYKKLSTTLSILVRSRYWLPLNILGVSGALLGLLGQAGIYFVQIEPSGLVGLAGFFTAVAGTALMLAPLLWDTIIWPILDAQQAGLLDFDGPIYRSKTFLPFFILAGLVYSLGYVLVGIATWRAGVLPAAAGLMLAIGAPLFGLGALFGKQQVIPRSIGVTLMSAALIWIGLVMTIS